MVPGWCLSFIRSCMSYHFMLDLSRKLVAYINVWSRPLHHYMHFIVVHTTGMSTWSLIVLSMPPGGEWNPTIKIKHTPIMVRYPVLEKWALWHSGDQDTQRNINWIGFPILLNEGRGGSQLEIFNISTRIYNHLLHNISTINTDDIEWEGSMPNHQ